MNTPQSGSNWGEQHHCEFGRWRCHWRRLGPPGGPALVLLHGFGAASGHWRSNVAGLAAAGYCVYAIDLLGFGQSDQPAIALDNRLWSRQLQQFLREVVQVPALLVGNSLGGLGAKTEANLTVTPGETLSVCVGGAATGFTTNVGYNGGGSSA
ncbi:MAG: alpha/beta fold hydrolase, partial [Synechococcaceae bacterium WB5_2B_268]|nr:alpha/beta fold hydrolase [Synechococcaceae bacterium WB5_2B_268]